LPDSTKVSKEFLEDYHGSFKVGQHLDSYGSGVTYTKSASGQGYASSDKSIKNKQSSYEHGAGYYRSEETVRTDTIHKEINVRYVPNNQTAGSVGINYTGKWSEGMAAEDSKMRSSIREQLSSADYLSREALMDSASLSMTGEFLGSQSLQTVVRVTGKNNESSRVEETFVGSYQLDTAISIHKPSKYLYPHLNVTKRAFKEDEETVLYRIAVTNDGNKTLANVYIEDILPEELTFVNSSLRPEVDGRKVSWSILSLPIGSRKTIDLRVMLNDSYIMIANRVNATASYEDKTVTAYGQCSMIMDRMPCCLERIEAHKGNITLNESRYFESGSWKPPECMGLTANCSDCNSYIDEYYDALNSTCICP